MNEHGISKEQLADGFADLEADILSDQFNRRTGRDFDSKTFKEGFRIGFIKGHSEAAREYHNKAKTLKEVGINLDHDDESEEYLYYHNKANAIYQSDFTPDQLRAIANHIEQQSINQLKSE